jgi:hypothetical protein
MFLSPPLFFASENALFSKNTTDNQIKTMIDGLSGQTILLQPFDKTLVGYENGLIVVINEAGAMLKVVDISISSFLQTGKVNHFMEFDGIVYVSCDFGIVQFNLKSAFGDTYFIGDAGTEISVRQTIHNGFIYAATNNGVRSASIINKT